MKEIKKEFYRLVCHDGYNSYEAIGAMISKSCVGFIPVLLITLCIAMRHINRTDGQGG